jgi:hypothetical protein
MSGYKQDFLAIKYDYDTQCSMSDDRLIGLISTLDAKIKPPNRPGTLSGPYIGRNIPTSMVTSPSGLKLYYAKDGEYTKIVAEDGTAKYYVGNPSDQEVLRQFDRAGTVPRGAYVYNPGTNIVVSDADIAAAFRPIGEYYANLTSIKERLNAFLEKASDDVADSEMNLAGEERYENRAHPENSVSPKEIAYGLFTELRTSTIPILLALGVFMASISILMIFQMIGFTGQINVPPALIQLQARLMAPSTIPLYENPMVLSGISIVLGVAVVILGIMYLRAKQGQ